MGHISYLTIKGNNQGEISSGASSKESVGSRSQDNHIDEIMVQSFEHAVLLPTDLQSGQVSGKRIHEAFILECPLDKSTPLIYNAVSKGEKIEKAVLTVYRSAESGGEESYFQIEFENAVITKAITKSPDALNPNTTGIMPSVTIHLSYDKINWNHTVAGTSGSDSWKES